MPPRHLPCRRSPAPGGRDHTTRVLDDRRQGCEKSKFFAHFLESPDVAAAIGPESEVRADVNLLDSESFDQNIPNKTLALIRASRWVNRQHQTGLDSGSSQSGRGAAPALSTNAGHHSVAAVDRMRVEGHGQRRGIVRGRTFHDVRQRPPDDQYGTIEVPDADHRAPGRVIISERISENLHCPPQPTTGRNGTVARPSRTTCTIAQPRRKGGLP